MADRHSEHEVEDDQRFPLESPAHAFALQPLSDKVEFRKHRGVLGPVLVKLRIGNLSQLVLLVTEMCLQDDAKFVKGYPQSVNVCGISGKLTGINGQPENSFVLGVYILLINPKIISSLDQVLQGTKRQSLSRIDTPTHAFVHCSVSLHRDTP